MAIPRTTMVRLETQIDVLARLLDSAPPALADVAPEDGGWSARENVAHLARHADIFLPRLQRLLGEDRPYLGTYRPDLDPEWPVWRALPLREAVRRVRATRARLISWAASLSEAQSHRTGMHPLLGEMDAGGWLEFFLLHEAHHLYFLVRRLGEARQRAEAGTG